MSQDLARQLERARKSLEKNKLREAVSEYQGILEGAPTNQEALQALADIYTRLNEPVLAAPYYAAQFDRLVELGDAAKASAIFTRFLRPYPQAPDRLTRYAALLQKQNRASEAIEQYSAACDLFQEQRRSIEALACCESIALLDPENPARHAALAELAERLQHVDLASRSYLRAGQLTLAGGPLDDSLVFFANAHRLAPRDRTAALLYANAMLRKGDSEGAVALLEPFSVDEKDLAFLALYGEALLRTGRLDSAHEIFHAYYTQKPDSFGKIFELAGAYIQAEQDEKAAGVLLEAKEWMRKTRRDNELTIQIDRLAASYPASVPLAETCAKIYEELNRETKFFEALVRLFDLYMAAGRTKEACESLDKLVDIDPYDYRNHERITSLEGKVDPAFLQTITARAAKASTVASRGPGFAGAGSDGGTVGSPSDETRAQQALDDLIVQVEIFLQYSLQGKALERLKKLAELYPDEETRNERLYALYERANWWPKGTPSKSPASAPAHIALPPPVPVSAPTAESTPPSPAVVQVETHRDLAAIAEINRLMYRQPTPREVLSTTAAGIGQHLGATRCLIAVPGDEAILTAEYFAPGVEPAGSDRIAAIVGIISAAPPDHMGGIELNAAGVPALNELGLQSALGVALTDKETQTASGALLVGIAGPRKWKPSDSFFLQAIGDQLVLSVSHTRLRSLVRSLSSSDGKARVLGRVAYIDSLLMESSRAQRQGTPLSLVMMHVDHGGDQLRQQGDAAFERYMDQLAVALCAAVRQTDVVIKYTAWSLVFILPNTPRETAEAVAEKLRQAAGAVPPGWGGTTTFSAVVAQSGLRIGDESEDSVTEWINRAEAGLEEVHQSSGNTLLALATP